MAHGVATAIPIQGPLGPSLPLQVQGAQMAGLLLATGFLEPSRVEDLMLTLHFLIPATVPLPIHLSLMAHVESSVLISRAWALPLPGWVGGGPGF